MNLNLIRLGAALAALLAQASCTKNTGPTDAPLGGQPGTGGQPRTGGQVGTGGRTQSGGSSGDAGLVGGSGGAGGKTDGGSDTAGSSADAGAPDAPACPPETPQSPGAPQTSRSCSIALTTLPGCTYPSNRPDSGTCFETFVCQCISDQMGGVDCYWQSNGLDCLGPFEACNPLSGAGAICGGASLSCLSCPSSSITTESYCTTPCAADSQCPDPRRPRCNQSPGSDGGAARGICTPASQNCSWGKCASPETRIATPTGAVPIAALQVGDLVLSEDRGRVVAVPITRVARVPVASHHVVRVTLHGGARLEISAPHPTADGRTFGDLVPGQSLGGATVAAVEIVPYRFGYTHDILPASDSGNYFAEGALIGSTLRPDAELGSACGTNRP